MTIRSPSRFLPALVSAVPLLIGSTVHAQGSGTAIFFDNTLYCQNQTTLVSCALWLNQDGTYIAYFNRGGQKVMPQSAAGPFQFEGREGTYTTRTVGRTLEACLKPAATDFVYNSEKAGEVFAAAKCYPLPDLAVGASAIVKEADGKRYKMWLLKGR